MLAAAVAVISFITRTPFRLDVWLRYDLGLTTGTVVLAALAWVAAAIVTVVVRAGQNH